MLHQYDVFEDKRHGCFQLRNKSEVLKVEFEDQEKRDIFLRIAANFQQEQIEEYQRLTKRLKKDFSADKVLSVFNELKQNDLLPADYTGATGNSQSDNGQGANQSFSFFQAPTAGDSIPVEAKVGLVGEGDILNLLQQKAKNSDFQNVDTLVLNDKLKDQQLIDYVTEQDFLIVDADLWNPYYLNLINETALEQNKPWMLIRGVEGGHGYVGPLFWGKETGCYHCLISRIKSNMEFRSYFEEYERYLTKHRKHARKEWAPPFFQEVLTSLALYEAHKFLSEWAVPEIYGAQLSLSFTLDLNRHTLLKSPLCEVCKPTLDYNLAPWLEAVTLS
jgi:bacteriocin biosynthesis cyclodehydratase domain-containing protein